MAANIVAVVLLVSCVGFAVWAIIKKHKNAKATGSPGCMGCSACCSDHTGCAAHSDTVKK